ncbi:eCIS core domain-containing protein [Streptomyces sp. HUAS TT7]|uniref:eCIS core domain-containing protein n=1 Tax=Streptomyces sp. HUAS TT7 TaxID=3447507 RepID=UPI003F65F6A8
MHSNDQAQAQTTDGKKPDLSAAKASARGGGIPAGLLALQRTAGNAAVVQMLRQAGHAWAQPEQHQHGASCGHQQPGQAAQPAVQRSAVHDVLRSGGRPLDDATRTDMEGRLGADFSDVRIHNDSAAKASAAEVGARAYTSGNHVVIGDGGSDKHTLAHELTHVIQQRQGPVAGIDNGDGLKVSDPSDRFEREAEANAHRVMSSAPAPQAEPGHHVGPASGQAGVVQRMWSGNNWTPDGDGDIHMDSQQTAQYSQSSLGSSTPTPSQFQSQSSSQATSSFPYFDYTPSQSSQERQENVPLDDRRLQAEAMTDMHTMFIDSIHEGGAGGVMATKPRFALNQLPYGLPQLPDGSIPGVTLLRRVDWVEVNPRTRTGALQSRFPATYQSDYFTYKINLINDFSSLSYIDCSKPFEVINQSPRSNGRGSQGRAYLYGRRWALNPDFWAGRLEDPEEFITAHKMDLSMRDDDPDPNLFEALPTSDDQPFIFYKQTGMDDDRFVGDSRDFGTEQEFDMDYSRQEIHDPSSVRRQQGNSVPPGSSRAGRSTATAMGGTQAHQWMDHTGGSGGRQGTLARYEWCHLIGDGDSGPNVPGNLVVGTNAVNTEQLAMETGLRRYRAQLANEGLAIELDVKATMKNASEQGPGGNPPLALSPSYPLQADWISYKISIVGNDIRNSRFRQELHRQIMDAERGTITEDEFTYLQNKVENAIKDFIEETLNKEPEADDVDSDVEPDGED